MKRATAERALEALTDDNVLELDKIRARYRALLETHNTLNTECRATEGQRQFAEGRLAESRDQVRRLDLERVSLIEQRAELGAALSRAKRDRWIFAGVGAVGATILAIGAVFIVRATKPQPGA